MGTAGADTYTIVSFGADGAAGPGPPPSWTFGDAVVVDIVLTDGVFLQVPTYPSGER